MYYNIYSYSLICHSYDLAVFLLSRFFFIIIILVLFCVLG